MPRIPLPRGWNRRNVVGAGASRVPTGPQLERKSRFLASSAEDNRARDQGVQYRWTGTAPSVLNDRPPIRCLPVAHSCSDISFRDALR